MVAWPYTGVKGQHRNEEPAPAQVNGSMKVKGLTEVNLKHGGSRKTNFPCSPTFKMMAPPLKTLVLLRIQLAFSMLLELKKGERKSGRRDTGGYSLEGMFVVGLTGVWVGRGLTGVWVGNGLTGVWVGRGLTGVWVGGDSREYGCGGDSPEYGWGRDSPEYGWGGDLLRLAPALGVGHSRIGAGEVSK